MVKGTQDVKHRADAQLLARGDGVTHGRVQFDGEEEADADFVDAAPDLLRFQIEVDAEGSQHIGAAALAGGGAVAMFGDGDAGASGDEGDRCADVEGAGTVATGATGIEHVAGHRGRHLGGGFAHGAGATGDFVGGFAFHAQRHEVGADLGFGGAAGHDLPHDRFGLFSIEMAVAAHRVDCGLDVHLCVL